MKKKQDYYMEERLSNFGVHTIKYCSGIEGPKRRMIVEQLVKSATSGGTSYRETINASSKRIFCNKVYIAKKKIAKSKYWLRMRERLGDEGSTRAQLKDESQEILTVLQKTVSALKQGRRNEI